MKCTGPYEGSCWHAFVGETAAEYCVALRFTASAICLPHSNFDVTRPIALYSDYHTGYDAVLHVAAASNFRRNLACVLNAEDGGETITGNSGNRLNLPGHSLNTAV